MVRRCAIALCLIMGPALALALRHAPARPAPAQPAGPHRSPVEVAVLPGGRLALTANHTAGTVSLSDLDAGKVLAEERCGNRPAAVVCSPDGKHAAVSNLWSGTISFFDIAGSSLKPGAQVEVGPLPRGLLFAPDGKALFAAVAGADEVVQIDVPGRKVSRRWPAPREPRHLALSPDGRHLAAASSRSGEVRCWNLRTDKPEWQRRIGDAFNLRGLAFTPDGTAVLCAHNVRRDFPVSKENIDRGWVIDNRLTKLAMKGDSPFAYEQVSLDRRGEAVADLDGLALCGKGRWLAVAASGTHELLLLDAEAVPWSAGDPGDHLSLELEIGKHAMRRVRLGGRPLALAPLPGGRLAVANYLLDAVQVVDAQAGKVIRSIPLGSPPQPSLARKGEAIFYDGARSHHQWFSCHTCHTDGHTCGANFDTLNDDSYGNAKLTPSLRHVTRTGPWTWHGWQKDLGASVEKSLTQTMFGPKPTADETKALLAYLGTLEHPPNPHLGRGGKPSAAARRGETVFKGKARCIRCHKGDEYTSTGSYDVKLEEDDSPYKLWNPPTLRGLWDRGPFLHDGRAATLDDLLRRHHAPEKLGGEALTAEERRDLVEFLKSL